MVVYSKGVECLSKHNSKDRNHEEMTNMFDDINALHMWKYLQQIKRQMIN